MVSTVFRYAADTISRPPGIYRQINHCMQEDKRMMKNKSKLVLTLILVGALFNSAAGTPNINFSSPQIADEDASGDAIGR